MSATKEKQDTQPVASIADLTEHRAETQPCVDKSVLMEGGPADGGYVTLSEFWNQTAFFECRDGNLGILSSSGERGISRDGGRTFEYMPKIVFPPTPQRETQEMGGIGGYNGSVCGIVRLPSGQLGMTWCQAYPIDGNQDVCKFWFRTSEDDGETWSEDVLVNPGGDKGTPYFDTLRLLRSGRIIQPVRWCHWAGDHNRRTATCTVRGEVIELEGHGHHPELEVAYCYFSDDQGKTWSRSKADIIGWIQDGWGNCVPCDEPNLDQLPDGRLLMLIRTTIGRLLKCISEDEGTTWHVPQPTQLAASYTPCAVRRIPKTGDVLCVWNQVSADEIRRGFQRQRLSAAITNDGETWRHFRTVDWHPVVEEGRCIAPEEKIQITRSLDHVGELPAGFGCSDYATIAFHGEEVILSYPHARGRHPSDQVGSMKHRILPLEWFYAAP